MTAGGRPTLAEGAKGPVDRRRAGELLQAGQYDQVAAILSAAQARCAEAGDQFTAHVLEMAGHLALACKQCREDAAWHQLAGREAEHRERGLREQLGRALRLIGTGRASGSSIGSQVYASVPLKASTVSAFTGESPGRSRWWRQILAWVGQKRPRPLSLQEGWEVSLSVPEASRPLRSDLPQDAPGEETTTELLTSDLSEQAHPSAPQPSALTENDPSGPSLAVYCLGRFRVYQDDRPIAKLTSSKARSILKYLIAHRERPVPKEVLMDLFWPNVPPDAARNNLNVAIYALRLQA